MKLGSLTIHSEKQQQQIGEIQAAYDDSVEKLHKMNKARHDLETKLTDEIEKNRALVETNKRKEESILSKQNEIEDMDKKIIDLERNIETIEVKS